MGERKVEDGLKMSYKHIKTCDVCGKDVGYEHVTLRQQFCGWGNDSIEACGTSFFCNEECLLKADTLDGIGNTGMNCINESPEHASFELNIPGDMLSKLFKRNK